MPAGWVDYCLIAFLIQFFSFKGMICMNLCFIRTVHLSLKHFLVSASNVIVSKCSKKYCRLGFIIGEVDMQAFPPKASENVFL